MAEKIEDSERRLIAETEVDEALTVPSVEGEFIKLEAGAGSVAMDDRLAALKQNMGLLPGGKTASPRQLPSGGKGKVQDAEAHVEAEGAPSTAASDAALIEQFDRLEGKSSTA